jgi:hypothetical protein
LSVKDIFDGKTPKKGEGNSLRSLEKIATKKRGCRSAWHPP